MKARPSPKKSRVAVDLDRTETALPPLTVRDLQLKRILVPIDFSVGSRKALQYAISLARQFAAEIMLIHVVQPVMYSQATMIALEATVGDAVVRKAATDELGRWREEIAAQQPVKTEVRVGTPYHEILRAADDTNSDLIVLGTAGRTGLAHVLIGSTAERVVRHATCPVLVVRDRAPES